MVAVEAVIYSPFEQEQPLLARWQRPAVFESLPLVVFLFVSGPENAETEIRLAGHVAIAYYLRDDEMTRFHGRNRTAFYTFDRTACEPMTLQQLHALKSRAPIG